MPSPSNSLESPRENGQTTLLSCGKGPRVLLRGIARVVGDRIILDGTTVDEVADVHRDTLKFVVEKVNQDIAAHGEQQRRVAESKEEELRRHRQAVEDAARKTMFD